MSDSSRPHELQPTRLLCRWDSPGQSTAVGCHGLLQGTFPTHGSNPGLLHWQTGSLPLAPPGKPNMYQIPLQNTQHACSCVLGGQGARCPSLPTRPHSPADAGGRADRAIGGGGRGRHGSRTEALERLHEAGGGACLGEGHSCDVGQVRCGGWRESSGGEGRQRGEARGAAPRGGRHPVPVIFLADAVKDVTCVRDAGVTACGLSLSSNFFFGKPTFGPKMFNSIENLPFTCI